MGSKDGYKLKREEYARQAEENNQLLYGFFGRKAEPVAEIRQRLDAQLRLTEVNKMRSEIAELNAISETTD